MTEFLEFPVNIVHVDEKVQRVDGVLRTDATAISDSMYAASGPLAVEENGQPLRDGNPRRSETSECDSTVVSRKSEPQ